MEAEEGEVLRLNLSASELTQMLYVGVELQSYEYHWTRNGMHRLVVQSTA